MSNSDSALVPAQPELNFQDIEQFHIDMEHLNNLPSTINKLI